MTRLIAIDLKKQLNSRSFIILTALYFISLGITTSSGMEFLKWLKSSGVEFGEFDPLKIPLYHFPDIWHNMTYFATYFKIILALIVIISITNEYSYRTIRQNIIDGLSRSDFLFSKLSTVILLSLTSTAFIFIIGLVTGLIYSPYRELEEIVADIEFLGAYFLEILGYLTFTVFVAMVVKRAGLTIGVILLYSIILEPVLRAIIPESVEWLEAFLPVNAFGNLIHIPYQKYIFMEIQDYVNAGSLLIVLTYIVLFIFLSYKLLQKRDI